jgi:hypothetical protein
MFQYEIWKLRGFDTHIPLPLHMGYLLIHNINWVFRRFMAFSDHGLPHFCEIREGELCILVVTVGNRTNVYESNQNKTKCVNNYVE